MFDWHFVGFHFVADVCLLLLILRLLSWIQQFAFNETYLSSSCPKLELWMETISSMVNPSTLNTLGCQGSSLVCVDTWKPSIIVSMLLWGGTIYGGSFILHLPSLWRKRVQLSHPFVPLDPTWYENLRKPKWTPPSAVFAITWISLKALQTYALALLWEASGRTPLSSVIIYKVCYLVLSDLFNQVFFVQHDIVGGFVILFCMIGTLIVILMESFRRVCLAGLLLCPLLLWMMVALILQSHILVLNRTSANSSSEIKRKNN
ncbi:hypothetical protein GpartN1_g1133.t1 [Galdieria partita]|uniref:Uncharacterized protein n=1 Tax=Galdieria partita TaxID=83374 RepID=A0A9C7PTD3_9RHOD|nr:hypothetical protein GpartN1_g1133.t1 [Galdieria partita]